MVPLYVIQMLLNLHKKTWMDGLCLLDYTQHYKNNEKAVKVLYCTYVTLLLNTLVVTGNAGVSQELMETIEV